MTASIRVRDLSKVFALAEHGGSSASLLEILRAGKHGIRTRTAHALRDISFDIMHGERVGIIGGNGAGKTTLLSILAGLTEPTSGTVQVEGEVHAMLTIGAVLRDDLTGRQNIMLDASIHGHSRKGVDAVSDRIITFSELGEFIDRPIRTYSSGMKARLAFSMGAFVDPDILILDETLSVGDVFFSKKAAQRMKEVADSGSIVILVSHAMNSIAQMCSRCLWLDQGQLIADGHPEAITNQYEKSVQQSDQEELRRKFSLSVPVDKRPQSGSINKVQIIQGAVTRPSSLAAMQPVTFELFGTTGTDGIQDITLRISRVDGRKVWQGALHDHAARIPHADTEFSVSLTLDPFVLGADLYRLDVELIDFSGICDATSRVFEVIDEEGQVGGQPLLYYPATVRTRRLGGIA